MLAENPTTAEAELATIAAANLAFVKAWTALNSTLSPLALCVAAHSESAANTIEWRDVFCRECEQNECLEGNAEQLAERVLALGWAVENSERFLVVCPKCQEVSQ